MSEITINLTEKEAIALDELCSIQELTEKQVLRQSLRLYQMFVLGHVKLLEPVQFGCGCPALE